MVILKYNTFEGYLFATYWSKISPAPAVKQKRSPGRYNSHRCQGNGFCSV